ncbi:hypothetical protein L204_101187 [Cryptococcus depauperatus]
MQIYIILFLLYIYFEYPFYIVSFFLSKSFLNMSSEPYDPYIPNGGKPSVSPGGGNGSGNPQNKKIQAIQSQIDETIDTMHDNIVKVTERGERIDNLQDKTEQLGISALGFKNNASRVRKQMWWKDMKMRIIIGIGIVVLIIIIVVPIVKATHK